MRVIRLGVLLVVLAGCGVASAQEPPPVACPAGLLLDQGASGGGNCVCPDSGEGVGWVGSDGVFVAFAVEPDRADADGDCGTDPREVTVVAAAEVVAVPAPSVPVSVPAGEPGGVLRRTG